MSSVELVVTDLDGTLWAYDSPHQPHDATLAAWRDLEAQGIPVLVATGRRVPSTRDPLAALGLAPPAVVLNGSLALDLASGEYFHRHHYDSTHAAAVLAAFRAHGLEPCVYVDHDDIDAYVSEQPSTSPEHLAMMGSHATRGDLEEVIATESVLSFSVFGQDQAVVARVAAEIDEWSTPLILRDTWNGSDGAALAVAPAGLSKWSGVLVYCERHGVDATRVLAIGDQVNDIELIASASVGVAVADGHPDAIAAATHVVAPTAEGGWAQILDLV